MFIAFLYMFRATMYPSSRENTVPIRDLILVTLYSVTNTCGIGEVFSPDDGHIVVRNM